jgi:short-subunit dehydrogenase
VITGGGAGIGRETVLEALRRGAKVAAVDLSQEGLAETRKLAGSLSKHLTTHVVNIADREAVAALPDAVAKAHGAVDGYINVAGIIHKFKRVNDLDFTEIERVVNVNWWGTVNLTKAFLPVLLKRPEAHITHVSSMGGYAPVPGQTIYGATKAAVRLLTEGLHSELKGTNVGVTTVFPGAVKTNIATNSGATTAAEAEKMAGSPDAPKFKMTEANVAGKLIIDGIENNSYHVFIGSDAKLMDRLIRLMPERAAALIFKQMASLLG